MLNQRSLNLGSRKSVARHVHHVVHSSSDPVVAFVITSSTISSELRPLALIVVDEFCLPPPKKSTHIIPLIHIQIGVHVSLVRSPDCAGHAGPWLLECQNALYIIAMNFFASDGVNDCRLDPEEGQRGRSRLCRRDASEWRNDMGSSLGLPVRL